MASEIGEQNLGVVADVSDYVANGSFAALKENVSYSGSPDHAVLVRLVDHNSAWQGTKVYVSESAYQFLRKSSLEHGDIVVANVGANAGTVFRVPTLDRPATLGPNAVRVRPRAGAELDRDYLYYWLLSPTGQEKLRGITSGSAQPKFNKTDMRALGIQLPPLSDQIAKAKLLSALDDRIDLLRQTNATLEAIAQALFKSWFVDFDPVRAKAEGRDPEGMDPATAALFPSEFEESELGMIPKGWSIRAVGDVATIIRGRSYKSSELADSDTALVTLKSFNRGGGFRRDGFKPYTGQFKPEQEVFEGDCIVAHTDVTQQAELIGRSAVVTRSPLYSRLVASLDVGIVRPKTDELTSIFLSALVGGDRYVSHIKGYTSGTTVLHLSKDGLPGFKFACPSPGLVKAYSDLAFAMFQRQATNIAIQESLAELRDTLLPRLISGKLRLPDAEESIEAGAA